METEYLSVNEVATLLAVSPGTIRNMIRLQRLPAVQLGSTGKTLRIARADLDRYIREHRTGIEEATQ